MFGYAGPAMLSDEPRKTAPEQKIHPLRKKRIAWVHGPFCRRSSQMCQNQLKSTATGFYPKAAKNTAFPEIILANWTVVKFINWWHCS
jgi:hypothetical protein